MFDPLMFAHERQEKIVALLEKHRRMEVEALRGILGVSAATLRRDLTLLDRKDRVVRVHGGVFHPSAVDGEPSFGQKTAMSVKAKRLIAEAVARSIPPQSAVFVDSGTTCLETGRLLRGRADLTLERVAVDRGNRQDIIAVPFALLWQVTLFLLPMQLVIKSYTSFFCTLPLFLIGLTGMYFSWWKLLMKKTLLVMGFATAIGVANTVAQDWDGPFTIIPASAPEMVLEAVGAGMVDGTTVSLNHPSTEPNKAWIITPKGDGFYTVRPSYSETLVLSASGGGTDNGTPLVLETDAGKPWQLWSIRENPDGSFSFVPQHAPTKGLDDFMGCKTVGAKLDIWDYNPADEHLQWYVKPLPGAKCPSAAKLGPWNIPRGTVREFTFEDSKIFPGTKRSGAVFIPAQYDGSKPACVYVHQDGLYWPPEIKLLEKLIAAGEMPVTIGIYIMPGYLPAPRDDTTGRLNRCLEYDGLGDKYVRFLTEELLPYVAKKFDLKLSTSGNDRCISGGSSGGIAAFNAAWERPDAFSRVFACSGSFVAFRGGNQFPTTIRLFEPKPIRTFLTTGTDDMENRAGSWFLLDQEVDKALTFSGYDHLFYIINGGHVAGWAEHFLEAMRYLWKGWPEPVQTPPGAPHVRSIIIPGENWSLVTQDYKDACSPASNSKGEVFFIAPATNQICRIGLDGKVEVFIQNAAQANGLAVGPHDELYTVSRRSGTVLCYNSSGGEAHAIIEGIPGDDILARPDGSLYITCNEDKDGAGGTVWLVKDGRKTQVDSGLKQATGMACRPDQWLLSVADGRSKWVYSYQIKPDGLLANKERFFHLQVADWDDDAGPESVCYAKEGQMLVATRWGIQVCAGDGPTMAILSLPDNSRVTGICLGGPEGDTLFAFAGDKVWKRKVRIHANGAFSPFTKVEGTPL